MEHNKKTPSPRNGHSGWEYDGKLWTFGGFGHYAHEYLNQHGEFSDGCNNQLFHFNPVGNAWTNVKCFGAVPSPRQYHATAAVEDTVWLYGGLNLDIEFADFYKLDVCSLTWTRIQTSTPKPAWRVACSLNVTRENQLVLHGGDNGEEDMPEVDTWVLDLSSYSWKCADVYSYVNSYQSFHTGSLAINNSIIIIGGDWYVKGNINNIMLEPKNLQQLAIKTVYKYRTQLLWKYLPKKLIKRMQHGTKDDTTNAQDAPTEVD